MSIDGLPGGSPDGAAGLAARLAFQPEPHTDFIFVVVEPGGELIIAGVLIATVALGVAFWRWRGSRAR